MWIKSFDGKAYNSDHFTSLELVENSKTDWVIGASRGERLAFVILGNYTDEATAKRDFDELLEKLEGFYMNPVRRIQFE
jgi:hypothetical protein